MVTTLAQIIILENSYIVFGLFWVEFEKDHKKDRNKSYCFSEISFSYCFYHQNGFNFMDFLDITHIFVDLFTFIFLSGFKTKTLKHFQSFSHFLLRVSKAYFLGVAVIHITFVHSSPQPNGQLKVVQSEMLFNYFQNVNLFGC